MPSGGRLSADLAEEMGVLQERITSTKTGSITSVQAGIRPADDLTDPSPATTFAHLDATVVLSRQIASWVSTRPLTRWTPPAVRLIRWLLVRNTTTPRVAFSPSCKARYQEPKDIIAILGMDNWPEEDKLAAKHARAKPALPVPAVLRGGSIYRFSGKYVSLKDNLIRGF